MYNCRHEGKLFPFMLPEEWSEIDENIYIKRINSKNLRTKASCLWTLGFCIVLTFVSFPTSHTKRTTDSQDRQKLIKKHEKDMNAKDVHYVKEKEKLHH